MILPIAVKEIAFYMRNVQTRMPFKYGAATLTSVPILHVVLSAELSDGRVACGVAADILPPKWFDKDPAKDYARNVEDLLWAARTAATIYAEAAKTPRSVFDIWRQSHAAVLAAGDGQGLNHLTAGHGSTLMERALIDAVGRGTGQTYFQLLKNGGLGVELGAILPELEGMETAEALASSPCKSMAVRHTVGLADPIHTADIAAADRLTDGLPQALEEYVRDQGITYFKIKVNGELATDLERLGRIAALLDGQDRPYHVTLDGNEQYHEMDSFLQLLDRLEHEPRFARLYASVLYIEQPLERSIALDADLSAGIKAVSARKPMLVDESDGDLDIFRQAVARGYLGVSAKNCKGLFKAVANQGLARRLSRATGAAFFLSGEDLMNLPLVPLQQDLAQLAALGIEHAERNGHHYVRGLDHLSALERQACLAVHADLYGPQGVRIAAGRIGLASLQVPGLGVGVEVDSAAMTALDAWGFSSLA